MVGPGRRLLRRRVRGPGAVAGRRAGVVLLVVAAVRLPGVSVLSSGFDVAYLLLLFVPVLPLVRWQAP